MIFRPIPRAPAPGLTVRTVDRDEPWTLAKQRPRRFTLVVFYRGYHCTNCRTYLAELERLLPDFARRGVDAIAISCDGRERAARSRREWGLEALRIGYGLQLGTARRWGLFLSEAVEPHETPLFCEPGLFLIDRENILYYAAINSMPFGRPHLDEVLEAVDFALEYDYPPRGEAA